MARRGDRGKARALLQLEDSACRIEVERDKLGLGYLRIDFTGRAAHLPSTSNNKEIRYLHRAGRKVPFIANSKRAEQHLDAVTMLFRAELLRLGIGVPSFLDEPVLVVALLPYKPRRHDSHNYSKPIGDWLETVGIIANDSQADIWCLKKQDYDFPSPDALTMMLRPRRHVFTKIVEVVREIA